MVVIYTIEWVVVKLNRRIIETTLSVVTLIIVTIVAGWITTRGSVSVKLIVIVIIITIIT